MGKGEALGAAGRARDLEAFVLELLAEELAVRFDVVDDEDAAAPARGFGLTRMRSWCVSAGAEQPRDLAEQNLFVDRLRHVRVAPGVQRALHVRC